MKRYVKKLLILALPTLLLVGCGEEEKWHQKLTVTVATPQGDVVGSSVTEVELTLREEALWMTTGYDYKINHRGEAVVVEVQPGKYLFAVLEQKQQLLALKVIAGDRAWGQPTKADREKVKTHLGPVSLGSSDYPLLVMFTNINDPKSVQEVKPAKLADRFGAGYALKSVTLEITDEAVTSGVVEKVIPWIGDPAVMERPNWLTIPVRARELLGKFLTDYLGAQDRFDKDNTK